jgi:hypothetical protein
MMKVVIIAMLCAASLAQNDKILNEFNKLQASKHIIQKISRKTSKFDQNQCWAPAHLPVKAQAASLLQGMNVPGAGIDKFKPFEMVLKDGFLPLKCVKDYMYYHGDKFGDNKHDYKLGDVSNVAIVHYDAFVAREDRAKMTQKKCFEFCRTVPNMGFFGIVNGRGCYCTPYVTPMESDSSSCDSVCEGDNTLMCGGKSKSSIFSMHMCDSTKEDLGKKEGVAQQIQGSVDAQVQRCKSASENMQNAAVELQKIFGAVGDTGATGLLQSAKVFAGELLHKAEDAEASAKELGGLTSSASSLSDFTDPETVTKAERVMEGITATVIKAKHLADELTELETLAGGASQVSKAMLHEAEGEPSQEPDEPDDATMVADRAWCTGPNQFLGSGMSVEECSNEIKKKPGMCNGYFNWARTGAACYCMLTTDCDNKDVQTNQAIGSDGQVQSWSQMNDCGSHTTVIFKTVMPPTKSLVQYYQAMYFVDKKFEKVPMTCSGDLAAKPIVGRTKDECAAACDTNIGSCIAFQYFRKGKSSLCFLLSDFKTGFYYTGCESGSSFLQTSGAPFEAQCWAKLSYFEGTIIKPQGSGKCKSCFKKLTKADRCYS